MKKYAMLGIQAAAFAVAFPFFAAVVVLDVITEYTLGERYTYAD